MVTQQDHQADRQEVAEQKAINRLADGGGILADIEEEEHHQLAGEEDHRAGRDEDAVCLPTVQRDRCANRASQVVVAIEIRAPEAAGRSLGEVITVARLVINDRDEAGRAGAEGVLGGGIGDTAGRKRRNGGRGTIGAAYHLVERASVGTVQGASGAVRGDAGRAAGGVEVSRPRGDRGRRTT